MSALREAAQQALEAMLNFPDDISNTMFESIAALKAALAQQDEPEGSVCARCGALAFDPLVKQQDEPVTVSVDALAQHIRVVDGNHSLGAGALAEKIVEFLIERGIGKEQAEPVLVEGELPPRYVARSPVQAEPVEPVAWVASKDGRVIYDNTSKDDGLLRVSGDFENGEQRISYVQQIVDKLNAAPPQRTMVPLTEEEILAAVGWERAAMYMKLTPSFPVNEAKKETLTNARAVEKAVWEKNNGQA